MPWTATVPATVKALSISLVAVSTVTLVRLPLGKFGLAVEMFDGVLLLAISGVGEEMLTCFSTSTIRLTLALSVAVSMLSL